MALDIHPAYASYTALNKALNGQKQLKILENEAKSAASTTYWGPWTVAVLHVKAFFEPATTAIFRALSSIFRSIGYPQLSLRMKLYSLHSAHTAGHLKTYRLFGEKFLYPAHNAHDLSTEDLWSLESVEHKKIKDPEVRKYLVTKVVDKISISSPGGVCRGIVEWFFYLYKKSEGLFQDKEQQLFAIAKFFENGAPAESTIIQSLDYYCTSTKEPQKCNLWNWEYFLAENTDKSNSRLDQYRPGSYRLFLTGHVLAYIKISPHLGYIYDPNYGLIKLEGWQSSQLLQYISKMYGKNAFHLEKFDHGPLK